MTTQNNDQAKIIPPSVAEMEKRLKNPESPESKLRDTCELVDAIYHNELIQLLRIVAVEHQRAALALTTAHNMRAVRAQEKESKRSAELYAQQQISTARQLDKANHDTYSTERLPAFQKLLDSLQKNMSSLLNVSQKTMSKDDLAKHHKQVTSNFNNQIAAAIGPSLSIALPTSGGTQNIALSVPQMTSKPVASVADILQHSPATPNTKRFAIHATLAGLGYLAVLNKWREVLEHNKIDLQVAGINIDDIQLTPKMLKSIDAAAVACINDNPQLLTHLLENNLRAMGNTDALAKLPTLFATRPVVGDKTAVENSENESKLNNKL